MDRDFGLERAAIHQLSQNFPVDVLHDDVRNRNVCRCSGDKFLTRIVNTDDTGVPHGAHRVRFTLEPLA